MRKYLLDTCILIDYLRGKKEAVDFLDSLEKCPAISALTAAELYAGVREGHEQVILDNLVSQLELIPVNGMISKKGGIFRRDFHKKYGTGLLDSLIASTAEESGITLVTLNLKHFPMLEMVLVPY